MHIAVCDDNIADRKQLERLLGREGDSRKEAVGAFYTDSFGTYDSLYAKRMSYDLFFLDHNIDFALKLCENGVSAPIVICACDISASDWVAKAKALPDNLMFLAKPILKAELSSVLNRAVEIDNSKQKTIELRHKDDTLYVHEDDIVYVTSSKTGCTVHLVDGQEISILDSIENMYSNLKTFKHFVGISQVTIINITHIEKNTPVNVCMKGGNKFVKSLYGMRELKYALMLMEQMKETT